MPINAVPHAKRDKPDRASKERQSLPAVSRRQAGRSRQLAYLSILVREVQCGHDDAGADASLEPRVHDGQKRDPEQDILGAREFPEGQVEPVHTDVNAKPGKEGTEKEARAVLDLRTGRSCRFK